MAQFAVEDLTYRYPGQEHPALAHVTLAIERGSYVCICGRSGCGKTTLLRHLKTVLAPHGERSGAVRFEGRPLEDVPLRDQAQFIGFVMQDPDAQVVTDKVWHELAFGLESLGIDERTMRVRVAEMASYFGIQHWFHEDVATLSGGQRQLLNLASVMAMQPSVLVLDEPTSQLDPIAAADLLTTVRKINRELGTTVIITEHRLEDVFATADAVVVMDEGRITASGSPHDVAEALAAREDAMMGALPAPLRVFYGVTHASPRKEALLDRGSSSAGMPPLTVREGRRWLLDHVEERDLPVRRLPDGGDAFQGVQAALSLKDVWFRYERVAPDVLRGLSVDVPEGALFAILGGNGTGKSTMLKVICGIERPYRGSVQLLGQPLKRWKGGALFRGGLVMLPQDPQNLLVKQTVRDELAEMIEGAPKARARIDEAAQACGVARLMDRHPLDLSGGERQRVALAKVLLADPRVLLLDEPTKGIDAAFKQELAEILRSLVSRGMTIVMVSHDVEFCARHADRLALFFDGSIVAENAPRPFFTMNSFYTTAANRMSRHVFANAVTDEDVIALCQGAEARSSECSGCA